MFLDFIAIRERGSSRILPKLPDVLRIFLIVGDSRGAKGAASGGYAGRPSVAAG